MKKHIPTIYNYDFEEYSQDSRHWEIKSTKKLTENELLDLWGYGFPFENMQNSIEVIRLDDGHKVEVSFRGTEYGDDTQCNYSGDFAEEEE